MFKMESYVAPYIMGYLGKYINDFNPSDFELSVWGGDLTLRNINLNLAVINQELNLPVELISGHIHELKLTVPWTSATSTPITININTIEITLRLKNLPESQDGSEISNPEAPENSNAADSEKIVPPDAANERKFLKDLVAKILNNIHVNLQNVIIKYVEEDIVLSVNITHANYCTVDKSWIPSFVDIYIKPPPYIMRKRFQFNEMTMCLDKTNNAGKIETYQPLLFKSNLEIRAHQEFYSSSAKMARFSRIDCLVDDMDFKITDEQVPMLMRLYNLSRSLFRVNIMQVPLKGSTVSRLNSVSVLNASPDEELPSESQAGSSESSVGSGWWSPWNLITVVLGAETEGEDEDEPTQVEQGNITCHYGFYCNKMSIKFCALEKLFKSPGRPGRVQFLPFLQVSLQGVVSDIVIRGDETNYVCGISYMEINPEGFCPCGIVDSVGCAHSSLELNQVTNYVQVGRNNEAFAAHSLFAENLDGALPNYDYNFKYEDHMRTFSEEDMLQRAHALVTEYLQTRDNEGPTPRDENGDDIISDTIDLGKDKVLVRFVVAPIKVAVCSGLVHRCKLISYAADTYAYDPYDDINKLMYPNRPSLKENFPAPMDLNMFSNFENAYDVYKITVFKPNVQIWAADHPEYDLNTRGKHMNQKRRIKSTTPFSHLVPNWPCLVLLAECIDVDVKDPNIKFKSLIARTTAEENIQLPVQFNTSFKANIFNFEIMLKSGKYWTSIWTPEDVQLQYTKYHRPELRPDTFDNVSDLSIKFNAVNLELTWCRVLLAQVICHSMVYNYERFAEHLLYSTLLKDFQLEMQMELDGGISTKNHCTMFLDFEIFELERVCTLKTTSDRVVLKGFNAFLKSGGDESTKVSIFEGIYVPPLKNKKKKSVVFSDFVSVSNSTTNKLFLFFVAQYPSLNGETNRKSDSSQYFRLSNSDPSLFVMRLNKFKITYEKQFLHWLNYHPESVEWTVPDQLRMRREVKMPLRPLIRFSSDIEMDCQTTTSDPIGYITSDRDFRTSSAPPRSILVNSLGGSSQSSSLPGYQQRFIYAKPTLEQELNTDISFFFWEPWFLGHMNVIKTMFIHIEIRESEVWFPLKSGLQSVDGVPLKDEGVIIHLPAMSAQPQSFRYELQDFMTESLPVRRIEVEKKFPLRISLSDVYFTTKREEEGIETCSDPLSILVTFSVETKLTTDNRKVTTAYLHTDIPAVNVELNYGQTVLMMELLEELIDCPKNLNSSTGCLLQPPFDSDHIIEEQEEPNTKRTDSRSDLSARSGRSRDNMPMGYDDIESGSMVPDDSFMDGCILINREEEEGNEEYDGDSNNSNDKASFWMQMTLGLYKFTMIGPPKSNQKGNSKENVKLVFEMEDITSSLDIQSVYVKFSHKFSNIRLLNYEKRLTSSENLYEWNQSSTLGVVFSSGDDITKDMQIFTNTFNKSEQALYTNNSRMSYPIVPIVKTQSTPTSPITNPNSPRDLQKKSLQLLHLNNSENDESPQKLRGGSFIINFTRVQSINYYKDGGYPNPISKWNEAVFKYAERDYEKYAPYEHEDKRYLNELDAKVKALDFVFNPEVFQPFMPIVDKLVNINFGGSACASKSEDVCLLPRFNNNTLPLIYLETEQIRVFLKSDSTDQLSRFKTNIPDFMVTEFSKITIKSLVENPLTRTISKPQLYQIAEKADVLSMPGSPIENRQYHVDFLGMTVSTGFWTELAKIHVQKTATAKIISKLKTQGNNPAYLWNYDSIDFHDDDVYLYPLLDRMEFSVALAPAIVYEKSPANPCKSLLIAGHSVEVNFIQDMSVNLSLQQITCLRNLHSQWALVFSELTELSKDLAPPTVKLTTVSQDPQDGHSQNSSVQDSGIDLVSNLPKIVGCGQRQSKKKQSVKPALDSWHVRHCRDTVPLEFLFTLRSLSLKVYEMKFNISNDVEDVHPLALGIFTQPYFVLSIFKNNQKIVASIADVALRFSSEKNKVNERIWIPSADEFDLKIFDTTPGEMNPKNGLFSDFFHLQIERFLQTDSEIDCNIGRSIKIKITELLMTRFVQFYDKVRGWEGNPVEIKVGEINLTQENKNDDDERKLRERLTKLKIAKLRTEQIVISCCVEDAEITLSTKSLYLSLTVLVTFFHQDPELLPDVFFGIEGILDALSASSSLLRRSTVLMTPTKLYLQMQCSKKINSTLLIRTKLSPLSFHIGPQSILAMLQIHSVFKDYFQDLENSVEEEIVEIIETQKLISENTYEDDLRAGAFCYSHVDGPKPNPKAYTIHFCEKSRTMTWTYSQERVIISVDALPIPITSRHCEETKLNCILEYYEFASKEFKRFSVFTLSENEGTRVSIPTKDQLHAFSSATWRVRIITPLELADSKHYVRSDILAACLKVNSLFDPSLVSKLRVHIRCSRVSIHFVNNFFFGGQASNNAVQAYTNHNLRHFDQPFASFTMEKMHSLLCVWNNHSTVNYESFWGLNVMDYEYLTNTPVLPPFHISTNLSFYKSDSCKDINSESDVFSKQVNLRLGGSTLHTILTSLGSWNQIVGLWNGKKINFGKLIELESINPNRILMYNTLDQNVKISQAECSYELTVIKEKECVPFYWTQQKLMPKLKLGLKEIQGMSTCYFDLKESGYKVRRVGNKSIFLNVAHYNGPQRLLTISGSLFVANGLEQDVEVAVLQNSQSSEIKWKVLSQSPVTSSLINLSEVEFLRFRLLKGNSQQSWSDPVDPRELRSSKYNSLCIPLFEERNEQMIVHRVWCTLVQEKLGEEGDSRSLVVLNPLYRVKSYLPMSRNAWISTSQELKSADSKQKFALPGKGIEQELEFTGDDKENHHLHFQRKPLGVLSSPTVPLMVDGPQAELELNFIIRPIDEILSYITRQKFGQCLDQSSEPLEKEEEWPFISEKINKNNWQFWSNQEETDATADADFVPWIKGLPTAVIEIRPCGLIVNLCGMDLYFTHTYKEENEVKDSNFWLPHQSVYPPSKINWNLDVFQFGLTINDEIVWSEILNFTEVRPRSDIHLSNRDRQIPLNCFSRLDIRHKNYTGHLTIETRLKNKMIVMTVRATYSIMNNTCEEFKVQPVILSSRTPQAHGKWKDISIEPCSTLKPYLIKEDLTEAVATPLTVSYSERIEGQEDDFSSSPKYLSLSCSGGPWWFVQLINFSTMFNTIESSEGVSAATVSVTMPKHDAEYTPSVQSIEDDALETATLPILVSWTSKNNQVWISITKDECPQILLYNKTKIPFIYVQSLAAEAFPFQQAAFFEQYLVLPPKCKSHYTFSQKYSGFPLLSPKKKALPFLLLTKLPQDLKDIMSHSLALRNNCNSDIVVDSIPSRNFRGTLLMPGAGLKWSNAVKIDGDGTQLLRVGDHLDVKITIEKIGYSHYIFIENMSDVEVAALDIRKRIQCQSLPIERPTPSRPVQLEENEAIKSKESENKLKKDNEMNQRAIRRVKIFFPDVSFTITEDFMNCKEKRELISFTFSDFYFERYPQQEQKLRRALKNKYRENWGTIFRIGDCQIDTPGFPSERTCDFPVFLKSLNEYNPPKCSNIWVKDERDKFLVSLKDSDSAMILMEIKTGQSSTDYHSIETLSLKTKALALHVEDRFIEFVLPALHSISTIVEERLPLLKNRPNPTSPSDKNEDEFYDALADIPTIPPGTTSGQFNEIFFDNTFTYTNTEVSTVESPKRTSQAEIDTYANNVQILSRTSSFDGSVKVNIVDSVQIPQDIWVMLESFGSPIHLESWRHEEVEVCLTLRVGRLVYVAVDHSRLRIPVFEAVDGVTTSYTLGQSLAAHYTTGVIFQIGNPMRLIGSLELLGSPGSLAQSVGMGLRDFVVYPYRGMLRGPAGFVSGLGNGVSSLVKSITSGALTSITNWAWSVSRNIDRMTMDEEEQILTEGARQVQLQGFTHGLIQGLTSFGIRLLGAIGGVAHHSIQNAIQDGATPTSVISGMGRGVIGAVTRPIGGLVELVAMTGEGILNGAGWIPHLTPKRETFVEAMVDCSSSLFKLQRRINPEDGTTEIILLLDGVLIQRNVDDSEQNADPVTLPITLILSTKKLYVMEMEEERVKDEEIVSLVSVVQNEDSTFLALRSSPSTTNDQTSLAQERMIEYIQGTSSIPESFLRHNQLSFKEQRPRETYFISSHDILSNPSPVDIHFEGSQLATPSQRPPLQRDVPRSTRYLDHITDQVVHTHPIPSTSPTMFSARSEHSFGSNSSLVQLYKAEEKEELPRFTGQLIGEFCVTDNEEFKNVLMWLKMNADENHFKVD